jgi:hypothetical protein
MESKMHIRPFVLSNVVVAAIVLGAGWRFAPQLDAYVSPCAWGVEAVDGDTIKCNGRLLRLKGLDTPELKKPACVEEREAALRAKARLAELLPYLDALPRKVGSGGGHGRWQTELWVKGTNVSDILIREGLAVRWNSKKAHHWCDRIEV